MRASRRCDRGRGRTAAGAPERDIFPSFIAKAVVAIVRGQHLLLVDLQPRTARDPDELSAIIYFEFGATTESSPSDKPLTLAAYDAGPPQDLLRRAGRGRRRALIDMPLFLAPGWYVSVPLEQTYQAAYRGVPRRFREILDTTPSLKIVNSHRTMGPSHAAQAVSI
jgi:hypothetical protein